MLWMDLKKTQGNSLGVIHFIGIGGIGMSGIAEIMHNLGYSIQGSDLIENYNTKRLKSIGVEVFEGHHSHNIDNVSYIVVSSAIKSDNPELQAALLKRLPIIKRAEMLAELMRLKYSIAVSGSHGKTTTTSLIACMFEAAGLSPTVINGGVINNKSTNAYLGSDPYLIAEADESDATFINIPATVAVITNIDAEHMDYYRDFETLVQAFRRFIGSIPFYGFAVACADHPVVKDLVASITERKVITYGVEAEEAHIKAYNIDLGVSSSTFDVKINLPNIHGSSMIERVNIPIPGKHNVLNALAAIAIAAEMDFGLQTIKNSFKSFKGVKRRFTRICEYNGASIIDDYAHHPIEVKATLATAKAIADKQNGRVIAFFQPHRYSRVQYLFDEFVNCFVDSNEIYITEIYGAGEQPIENISGQELVGRIKSANSHSQVEFVASREEITQLIANKAQPGDFIVIMGAGSISSWANDLAFQLVAK